MIFLALIIFFRIVLAIHGPLCFQMSFPITFSSSEKNVGILTGFALNLYGTFGNMNILIC